MLAVWQIWQSAHLLHSKSWALRKHSLGNIWCFFVVFHSSLVRKFFQRNWLQLCSNYFIRWLAWRERHFVEEMIVSFNTYVLRALKTRGNTPKYGLIFHSSFIGRASSKNKGRMARYLANKCSIASRIDCFSGLFLLNMLLPCRFSFDF